MFEIVLSGGGPRYAEILLGYFPDASLCTFYARLASHLAVCACALVYLCAMACIRGYCYAAS